MTLNTTYNPTVADGNGVTTQFSYSFNPISINYLKVSLEISGEWVQQFSGWAATVSESGGIVTFDTAPTTRVAIERDVPEEQPTSYETSSGFQAKVIEHSFDMLTGMVQELKEKSDRSLSMEIGSETQPEEVIGQVERIYSSIDNVDTVADNITDITAIASDLSALGDIASDLANINAVNTNKANINKVANNITDVNTVANNISEVSGVGSNIASVSDVASDLVNVDKVANNQTNIDAVAGIDSDVSAVASIKNDVSTVSGISTDVTAVASNSTNVNSVANNMSRVNSVGNSISNVNKVGNNITDVNAVASDLTNIDTVASGMSDVSAVGSHILNVTAVANDIANIDAVAGNQTNIDAVALNNTNVTRVGSNINNVNTVASSSTDINTIASNISDVSNVASYLGSISSVASSISDVNAVASDLSNLDGVAQYLGEVDTVSSNITNVNAVAGDITNINNVASDLANINAVAGDLTNINNASTYATNSKKWAEGTDGEVTPLGGTHSAKGWAEIAEQAASGVQNPANRDLSNLTTTGQMVIDSQNDTISNCILEIPQDIKLELNNGTLTLKAGSKVYKPNGSGVFNVLNISVDKTFSYTSDGTWIISCNGAGNMARCIYPAVSGNTEPSTHPLATLWYDTTNNTVKRWSGSAWESFSFPIAIITVSNGAISSIDKVFNGAGYVGHHAFVLPGVKSLIPQGKENGHLISSLYTTSSVAVYEMATTPYQSIYGRAILLGSSAGIQGYGDDVTNFSELKKVNTLTQYCIDDNRRYKYSSSQQRFNADNRILFVKYEYDGTNVTRFDIVQPYENVRDLLGQDTVNRALSVHGNTFKIYQPTLSDSRFGMFFLFVFPDGHNILYDCGYVNEENDIDTFLASLNITHLDVVIVSHFHGDHAGCAPHIINNYCDMNTKFFRCMDCDFSQFTHNETGNQTYVNNYNNAISAKGFTSIIPENKSSVELFNGTVELTFYNTDTNNLQYYYGNAEMIDTLSAGSTANNTSMCCLIRAYGTSVFMTGDIEYAGQKAIADYVPQNVDIFQVPHHGVNKNGYAPFFDRTNGKVYIYQKNDVTSQEQYTYYCRYLLNNSKVLPVINNATTTGIELECWQGNIKLNNGIFVNLLGDLNDHNIRAVIPSPYDTVHNADEYATWTIADVVNMCNYKVEKNMRLGSSYETTQLVTELNTLVPSSSWIITPHVEYITIQDRTDITKAEVRAKSVSDHS